MKKLVFPILMLAVSFLTYSFYIDKDAYQTIEIGDKAPMTTEKMMGISNQQYSLDDVVKSNGLLVIFSCNTCPFVVAWEDRYPILQKLADEHQIGMVLINSNEAKRSGDDSMSEMKTHAKENNYTSKYLLDKGSRLANAFGAKTTPHVFLFNSEMELVYRGAIDDNHENKENVKEDYLKNAIEKLAKKEVIDPNQTRAVGCSIKRTS